MSVDIQEMIHFHLTGKQGGSETEDVPLGDVCPALLAPYRELRGLRYDFPLVLLDDGNSQALLDTLSGVMNRLLREIAPEGNSGARLRQHVLRLETRMRELLDNGRNETLARLWKRAEKPKRCRTAWQLHASHCAQTGEWSTVMIDYRRYCCSTRGLKSNNSGPVNHSNR